MNADSLGCFNVYNFTFVLACVLAIWEPCLVQVYIFCLYICLLSALPCLCLHILFVYLPSECPALRIFTIYFVCILALWVPCLVYVNIFCFYTCLLSALPCPLLLSLLAKREVTTVARASWDTWTIMFSTWNTWNIAKAWTFGNDVFGQMENSSKMCDISLSLWVSESLSDHFDMFVIERVFKAFPISNCKFTN